jgi:hypothetical protein
MPQKPLGKGNSKKSIPKVGKGLKKVSGNKGKLYEQTKKGLTTHPLRIARD